MIKGNSSFIPLDIHYGLSIQCSQKSLCVKGLACRMVDREMGMVEPLKGEVQWETEVTRSTAPKGMVVP